MIYDAAHCFGTGYKGKSVYDYGDISTASFHATKLFHTVEGGAIITKDAELDQKVQRMRNFGHAGPGNFEGVGINGKNSEFHAAMGLCNLEYIGEILQKRKAQCQNYDLQLDDASISFQQIQPDTKYNYAYYPVIFKNEKITLQVKEASEEVGISPRRYFYPSLCELEYASSDETTVSVDISKRILCLPLYYDLFLKEQKEIAEIIRSQLS